MKPIISEDPWRNAAVAGWILASFLLLGLIFVSAEHSWLKNRTLAPDRPIERLSFYTPAEFRELSREQQSELLDAMVLRFYEPQTANLRTIFGGMMRTNFRDSSYDLEKLTDIYREIYESSLPKPDP